MFNPNKPFEEYISNSFCKEIDCAELPKRLASKPNECLECKAYKFHDHLNNHEYHIIRNIKDIVPENTQQMN